MPRNNNRAGSPKTRREKKTDKQAIIRKVNIDGHLIPFVDISALIREIGTQVEDGQKETFLHRALYNAWRKAANGNDRSLIAMLEYGFGKPATAQKDSLEEYFRAKVKDAGLSAEQIVKDPTLRMIAAMVGFEIILPKRNDKKEIPEAEVVQQKNE